MITNENLTHFCFFLCVGVCVCDQEKCVHNNIYIQFKLLIIVIYSCTRCKIWHNLETLNFSLIGLNWDIY